MPVSLCRLNIIRQKFMAFFLINPGSVHIIISGPLAYLVDLETAKLYTRSIFVNLCHNCIFTKTERRKIFIYSTSYLVGSLFFRGCMINSWECAWCEHSQVDFCNFTFIILTLNTIADWTIWCQRSATTCQMNMSSCHFYVDLSDLFVDSSFISLFKTSILKGVHAQFVPSCRHYIFWYFDRRIGQVNIHKSTSLSSKSS